MVQLRERHIIAATKLGFSFTNGFFVLGGENVVTINQRLWFDHHGSVGALKLDKIAFPQAEVFAEPFGNNDLPSLSYSANGSGYAFCTSDSHTVRIAETRVLSRGGRTMGLSRNPFHSVECDLVALRRLSHPRYHARASAPVRTLDGNAGAVLDVPRNHVVEERALADSAFAEDRDVLPARGGKGW